MGFRVSGRPGDYLSDWFTSFSNYSRFVKEDFLIRSFFDEAFFCLFRRCGVTSVLISRRKSHPNNLLELIVSAKYPRRLVRTRGGVENVFEYLVRNKAKLTRFVTGGQRLRIKLRQAVRRRAYSSIIVRRIVGKFEGRMRLGGVVRWLKRRMRRLRVVGYKVLLSGRIGGKERARAVCVRDGRVCLHTIRSEIDYSVSCARTVYGSLGVKVWVCRGGLGIQKEVGRGVVPATDERRRN
jgi:small subunit ribosomal protein S3